MRRGIAVAAILVAVAAACGQAPGPTEPSGQPIVVEGRAAEFVLSLRIGSDVVDAGAPIDISAILTWEGAAGTATIWGSGGGPVSFGLAQVDGNIALGPASTADCAPHEYARLVPTAIPYHKSGGILCRRPERGLLPGLLRRPDPQASGRALAGCRHRRRIPQAVRGGSSGGRHQAYGRHARPLRRAISRRRPAWASGWPPRERPARS